MTVYALGLRRLICSPLPFATTQPVPPPLTVRDCRCGAERAGRPVCARAAQRRRGPEESERKWQLKLSSNFSLVDCTPNKVKKIRITLKLNLMTLFEQKI